MAIQDLLSYAQKDFRKKYGKTSELEIEFADEIEPVTGLVVDNPLLEYVLDRRFLPYGRCYLIYGKKGCSKTSLFLYLAKLFQQSGGDVIWIETEKAADLDYAAKQGVDLSRLVMPKVDTLQEALTTAEAMIKNLPKAYPNGDTPVLIGLDSIAGAIPEYETQDSITVGETKVGEHARLMSGFYRRIIHPLAHEKAIFVALNQLKTAIGGMKFGAEEPEAMIGGEAPRFHSTYQWKMYRVADLTKKNNGGVDRKVGSKHSITCKRNKLGREGNTQKIEFDLYIDGGPDFWGPLVKVIADNYTHLATKRGGYYYWKVPDVEYDELVETVDNETGEVVQVVEKKIVDTEKAFRERDLAIIFQNSTQIKEMIRKEFGIPDLPPEDKIKEAEAHHKKKRVRMKDEDADNEVQVEL